MARKKVLTFKGMKKFEHLLEKAETGKVVQKHMGKGTLRILKLLEAEIRQEIKKKPFRENAALTVMIKNTTTPLVGPTAQLFHAVKGEQYAWNSGFVGVNKKSDAFDIAKTVHDGKKIKVTERMRGLFLILSAATQSRVSGTAMPKLTGRAAEIWAQSKGKTFYPLNPATTRIRIPPRRFVTNVTHSRKTRKLAQREWERALGAAFKELAGK